MIDMCIVNELKVCITTSMNYYWVKMKNDSEQLLQIYDADAYNSAAILLNNVKYLLPINVTVFNDIVIPVINEHLSMLLIPKSDYPTTDIDGPTREEIIYENTKQLAIVLNYYNTNTAIN